MSEEATKCQHGRAIDVGEIVMETVNVSAFRAPGEQGLLPLAVHGAEQNRRAELRRRICRRYRAWPTCPLTGAELDASLPGSQVVPTWLCWRHWQLEHEGKLTYGTAKDAWENRHARPPAYNIPDEAPEEAYGPSPVEAALRAGALVAGELPDSMRLETWPGENGEKFYRDYNGVIRKITPSGDRATPVAGTPSGPTPADVHGVYWTLTPAEMTELRAVWEEARRGAAVGTIENPARLEIAGPASSGATPPAPARENAAPAFNTLPSATTFSGVYLRYNYSSKSGNLVVARDGRELGGSWADGTAWYAVGSSEEEKQYVVRALASARVK